MIAVRTPLKRSDIPNLARVRAGIERRIPMSKGRNNLKLTATAAERADMLARLANETKATPNQYDKNWKLALGTLGGGNHFIELAEDGDGSRVVDAAFRVARRWKQDRHALHPGRAGVMQENRIDTTRPRPRLLVARPSGIQRLHTRPELGAAVRVAQSQRDDGPGAGGSRPGRLWSRTAIRPTIEVQRINSHHNFTQQQESHFGETVWVTLERRHRSPQGPTGR